MMGPRLLLCCIAALAVSPGCSTVRSTSTTMGTPSEPVDPSEVIIAATFVPEGARQVAVVEAHANFQEGFEAVMEGFREEVGASGGNFGKVDSMRTHFEVQNVAQTQTYQCGSPAAPQICTRSSSQPVEVAITTITGRAFRVGAR